MKNISSEVDRVQREIADPSEIKVQIKSRQRNIVESHKAPSTLKELRSIGDIPEPRPAAFPGGNILEEVENVVEAIFQYPSNSIFLGDRAFPYNDKDKALHNRP